MIPQNTLASVPKRTGLYAHETRRFRDGGFAIAIDRGDMKLIQVQTEISQNRKRFVISHEQLAYEEKADCLMRLTESHLGDAFLQAEPELREKAALWLESERIRAKREQSLKQPTRLSEVLPQNCLVERIRTKAEGRAPKTPRPPEIALGDLVVFTAGGSSSLKMALAISLTGPNGKMDSHGYWFRLDGMQWAPESCVRKASGEDLLSPKFRKSPHARRAIGVLKSEVSEAAGSGSGTLRNLTIAADEIGTSLCLLPEAKKWPMDSKVVSPYPRLN